jgi:hypothetical protein
MNIRELSMAQIQEISPPNRRTPSPPHFFDLMPPAYHINGGEQHWAQGNL